MHAFIVSFEIKYFIVFSPARFLTVGFQVWALEAAPFVGKEHLE